MGSIDMQEDFLDDMVFERHDGQGKVTLFPTRLREFEEKNNLVFNHFLGAKKQIRRNSETPCFGDQYTRRASCTEDLVDDDDAMYNVLRNIFRRTSTTDKKSGRYEVLETRLIPLIFARMGQEYDTAEMARWIKANDRHGLGIVDFNGYQRICVHFLKDPEAIQKAKTEEFSFQNLIRKDGEEDEEDHEDPSDSNSDHSSCE